MRISDWSSDVCSSDRIAAEEFGPEEIDRVTRAIEREAAACEVKSSSRFATANEEFRTSIFQHISNKALRAALAQFNPPLHLIRAATLPDVDLQIGRASCRERVGQKV